MQFPDPLAGVVFDMDGTLLDTEQLYRSAMYEAAEQLGVVMTDAVQLSLVGTPRDIGDAKLLAHYGPDFPVAAFRSWCHGVLNPPGGRAVPLKPGAMEILTALRDARVPVGLAASTPRFEALPRLDWAGLTSFLGSIVTRDDVQKGKPDPQSFQLAAAQLGIDAGACVAVEDSYSGVSAAVAAGMTTVMIPDMLPPTPAVLRQGVVVMRDLNELQRALGL